MFIHESTHALDKLLGRDTDSPAPDSPYGYDINIGEHNAVNEANRYRESVNELYFQNASA